MGIRNAQSYAAERLKTGRYKMQCLDLPKVMMAGGLDVMCLDKTGTLTEPTLEFGGIQRCLQSGGKTVKNDFDQHGGGGEALFLEAEEVGAIINNTDKHLHDLFTIGLATCHTVTKLWGIEEDGVTSTTKYVGNSVECEMVKHALRAHNIDFSVEDSGEVSYFAASGSLGRNSYRPEEQLFRTVQQFEFDQKIQLQSVVAEVDVAAGGEPILDGCEAGRGKDLSQTLHDHDTRSRQKVVFTKGSFERVAQHCRPDTLPPDYEAVTKNRASDGLYVLALAAKLLEDEEDVEKLSGKNARAELEQDLTFLGLLLFRNELRPCSALAVKELSAGGIQSRIVTGDNVWTGLRVADQCGVVDMSRMLMCVGDLDKDGGMVWELNLPADYAVGGGAGAEEEEILDDVDFEEVVLRIDFDAERGGAASRRLVHSKSSGVEHSSENGELDSLLSGVSLPKSNSRVEIRAEAAKTAKNEKISRAGAASLGPEWPRNAESKASGGGAAPRQRAGSYFGENVFTADSDVFRGPAIRSARGSVSLGSIQGGKSSKRTPLAAVAFTEEMADDPGTAATAQPPQEAPQHENENPRRQEDPMSATSTEETNEDLLVVDPRTTTSNPPPGCAKTSTTEDCFRPPRDEEVNPNLFSTNSLQPAHAHR